MHLQGPAGSFFFSSQEERMCAQYHKHMITGRSSWYTGCRYVIKEDDIKRLRLPWRNSTFSYILLLKITCFINVDDASYTGSRIHACECMWCYISSNELNAVGVVFIISLKKNVISWITETLWSSDWKLYLGNT